MEYSFNIKFQRAENSAIFKIENQPAGKEIQEDFEKFLQNLRDGSYKDDYKEKPKFKADSSLNYSLITK